MKTAKSESLQIIIIFLLFFFTAELNQRKLITTKFTGIRYKLQEIIWLRLPTKKITIAVSQASDDKIKKSSLLSLNRCRFCRRHHRQYRRSRCYHHAAFVFFLRFFVFFFPHFMVLFLLFVFVLGQNYTNAPYYYAVCLTLTVCVYILQSLAEGMPIRDASEISEQKCYRNGQLNIFMVGPTNKPSCVFFKLVVKY